MYPVCGNNSVGSTDCRCDRRAPVVAFADQRAMYPPFAFQQRPMTRTPTFPSSLVGFSEQDIREEIITPLLHQLGYGRGTAADILREVHLRYPCRFIGRKKPRRDPPISGYADYILDASGVRWTIEAKASTAPISADDIDQAYSYANHPEIRAALFCLMNGHELQVYQTNRGPDVPPLLAIGYSELIASIDRLANILGPSALIRNHPAVTPDLGEPIGPGLRSVVRITSGVAEFLRSDPPMPFFDELTLFVQAGGIERDDDGHLVVFVETTSPFRSVNAINERLGLKRFELASSDRVLSVTPGAPTVLRGDLSIVLPEGEAIPNLLSEGELVLTRNVRVQSSTTARGILTGSRLAGTFSITHGYSGLPNLPDEFTINVDGRFEIHLG